jgi:5-bromo-4-chloroindolyl phosphate hydrolysis protein
MKNSYIKFRCTKSEKERIEGMAERSGVTLSEYCRQQCLNGRILANPKLSLTEISYFRALKEHNNALARIANLIRNKDPQLVVSIKDYLEQSRQLYNRFF